MKLGFIQDFYAVYGVDQVESLEIADERQGAVETIEDPGREILFMQEQILNTELYQELTLENGFIPVNETMEREFAGVYAVGDIRVKQVRESFNSAADGTHRSHPCGAALGRQYL